MSSFHCLEIESSFSVIGAIIQGRVARLGGPPTPGTFSPQTWFHGRPTEWSVRMSGGKP